ncbi:hypothetical protein SAY87_011060 [Trapa incisa]|uniref:Uncharacterized protein n=1 Tax=Trapa incisa TaxID=236973 RepID=A0AAN7GI03_9MYRT|nr:hypothetical protein SAY87_011060 [Trapa incisa]
MAATHRLFNYAPATASAAIHTATTDHLNMLGLRDVVFISPQQQAQPILPSSATAALGVGVSIFPLLAATPCVEIASAADPPQPPSNLAVAKDNIPVGIEIERLTNAGGNGGGGGSSGLRACRDCGNRAKKECSYRRCRTCCKSRGYDCATHVKSTWVPAAQRRERQVAMVGISFAGAGGCSSRSSSGATAKKQRIENASSASNSANLRSFSSSPFRQEASFKQSLPGQVRAPAVFRCIRVTAISDNAAEFAYLATVSISGHIFKGFLYDHGTNTKNGSSSIACISELRLEEGTASLRNRGSSPPPPPLPIASSDAFTTPGDRRLLGDLQVRNDIGNAEQASKQRRAEISATGLE